ncbi:MAG: 50S ribosomal protein L15 [Deltaproteobacteria bacterium]|nr:MAG: 50S ribosomal protein L15 [Deltaproteobacteria bacterium]TMA71432.1 MAG: 50S ribosomal protein L15 [Deltaproteobacteria bacterium]TMB20408.1 MAG: 50S ribosomal protein L15 [Deltaproteobacteria bacterium]
MDLSRLHPASGATREKKRVGRGPGSGHGKTASRGHKGRRSRSGGNSPPGYEGGQMPLQRRLPKRGFHPPRRVAYAIVNLGQLAAFPPGSTVGPAELRARGIVRGRGPVKCLADGTLGHALSVRLQAFSARAREQIAAAGGSVEVVGV